MHGQSFEFGEILSANRLGCVSLHVRRDWFVKPTAVAEMTGEALFNQLQKESDVCHPKAG